MTPAHSSALTPAPPPVPRPLLVLSAVVVVLGVVMIFVGGWRTGVSWDETYHVMRMRNFLEHGWYLLDGDLDGGEPGAWEDEVYVYSPVTMGFLHLWTMLWGVEAGGEISASDHAFAVRHTGVGLIALLGLWATAYTARILFNSRAWALVCAAVLVAIPMWTGHAMFNLKDIPAATGFSLVTLAAVLLARRTATEGHRWAAPLALAAGLFIGIGTRPGMWPGLAACLGALLVLTVLRDSEEGLGAGLRANLWRCAELAAGLLAGAAALLAAYPNVFSTPFTALIESALSSAQYAGASAPWWYVPVHVGIEMPLGLLFVGLFGTGIAVSWAWRSRWRLDVPSTIVVLLGLQVFLMPALAMAKESNLYNGLRQLLFAAPAMAVLITLGLTVVVRYADRLRAPGRRTVLALVAVAVAVPVLTQVRMFPYNYAYASVPTDLVGGEQESDYWRTSVRELAPLIPKGGVVVCSPMLDEEGNSVTRSHESNNNCVTDPIGPLAPYADLRGDAEPLPPTEFYAVVFGGKPLGKNCEEMARVTRPRLLSERLMSLVARCDLVLEPYPGGRINFGDDGSGHSVLMGGWSSHRTLPGVEPVTSASRLGFELPESLRDRPLRLLIETTDVAGVPLSINGTSVEPVSGPEGFVVQLPAETAGAYGQGRLVFTFEETPGLRLLGLTVTEGKAS